MPVDAPEGTLARNVPCFVSTSTSTVGLPRESRISHARTAVISPSPPALSSVAVLGLAAGAKAADAESALAAAKAEAARLKKELARVNSAPLKEVEVGIRQMQAGEAHGDSHFIKISWKLDQVQMVDHESYFMQDLVSEFLRKVGADQRTGPAPPGEKERRMREALNRRRIAAARKRR